MSENEDINMDLYRDEYGSKPSIIYQHNIGTGLSELQLFVLNYNSINKNGVETVQDEYSPASLQRKWNSVLEKIRKVKNVLDSGADDPAYQFYLVKTGKLIDEFQKIMHQSQDYGDAILSSSDTVNKLIDLYNSENS